MNRNRKPLTILPEEEFIVCCVNLDANSDSISRIERLVECGIDWDILIEATMKHRLMPVVYTKLKDAHIRNIPESLIERLCILFRANVQRNLLLSIELLEILNILQSHGIMAVPFKGPALSSLLYGHIGMRQIADLDVFVREEHALKAKTILVSNGYQPRLDISDLQALEYQEYTYSYGLTHRERGTDVDLHWSIARRHFLNVPLDGFWNRIINQSFLNTSIDSFSIEDTVVALCIHGSKHGWMRLEWLYGLATIIRTNDIDWEKVSVVARVMNATRMLNLSLLLCVDIFLLELPEQILSDLKSDRRTQRIVPLTLNLIFSQKYSRSPMLDLFQIHLFRLSLQVTITEKINYCYDLVVTPTASDWSSVRMPKYATKVYILMRPYLLLSRMVIKPVSNFIWKRIRGR